MSKTTFEPLWFRCPACGRDGEVRVQFRDGAYQAWAWGSEDGWEWHLAEGPTFSVPCDGCGREVEVTP